jgi:hypothetical protein
VSFFLFASANRDIAYISTIYFHQCIFCTLSISVSVCDVEGEMRERREEGGMGWQVDYGPRSRCQETVGTRDTRLLGNRCDAMTSAV